MELVDGCDLRSLLRALAPLGPPPPGLAAFVAHEVARALGAAHAMRPPILHRDVSTTNVLVARTGAVKLADFGIGKALEEASTDGTASLEGQPRLHGAGAARARAGRSGDRRLRRRRAALGDAHRPAPLRRRVRAGRVGGGAHRVRSPLRRRSTRRCTPALDAICARATAHLPAERWSDGSAMARALEPELYAFGFGPTQLAALMRDFAPPPVEDEPRRHTMTAGERHGDGGRSAARRRRRHACHGVAAPRWSSASPSQSAPPPRSARSSPGRDTSKSSRPRDTRATVSPPPPQPIATPLAPPLAARRRRRPPVTPPKASLVHKVAPPQSAHARPRRRQAAQSVSRASPRVYCAR